MSASKRIQRPRLELKTGSGVYGGADKPSCPNPDKPLWVGIRDDDGGATANLSLKDAKRLHAFLGKAIAYLESRRK